MTAAELSWWVDARREVRLEISRVAEAASGSDHDSRLIAIRALVDPIANGGAVIMGLRQVDARTVHDPTTLRNLGLAAYAVGDPEMALVVLGQAERQCREQALLGLLPHVLCVQAAAHGELGDWELAASRAAESEDAAQGTGQTSWLAAAKAHRARALALQSDSEGALALADESERLALQRGLHGVCMLARAARGAAWLGAGRYAEAFDELVSIFDNADPGRTVRKRMAAVSLLVEAAVDAPTAVEDVRSLVGELERMGDVTIAPLLQVQLHSVRPQLASDDDAEAAYRSALDEDLSRWAWSRVLIELGYGSWLRRQRRCPREPHLSAPRVHRLRHRRRGSLGRAGSDGAARRR